MNGEPDLAKGPWLSVLMPVYNGAATLRQSLASVESQGEGIEVILVDQGSSDGSKEIAERFSGSISLRVISHPKSSGWHENTNLALSYATAPFACFLHQDDYWNPGRAQLLKAMIERHPDASLWVHGAHFVDEQDKIIGRFSPPFGGRPRLVPKLEALRSLLVQDTIALPAAMFRTSDARDLGGLDTDLRMTADWDLWLKLAQRGDLAWSPVNAVSFRLHLQAQTIEITGKTDFYSNQLVIPLERHITSLPAEMRGAVEKRARASNALNVLLASRFHGYPQPVIPVLVRLLALNPLGWMAFLRDTQILRRLWPRLRLLSMKHR